MAFMNSEKKRELTPGIKKVLKKYGMKGTISVRDFSNLIVKIKSGPLDIIGNSAEKTKNGSTAMYSPEELEELSQRTIKRGYIHVNEYHIESHFSGEVKRFLLELKEAMMKGNHENSDSMVDYYDVGWYIEIHVGTHDKPYELLEKS